MFHLRPRSMLRVLGITLIATLAYLPLQAQDWHVPDSPAWRAEKRASIRDVVQELRGRARPDLSSAQAERRLKLLDALEAYADQEVFPINDRFPTRLVPYFIDGRGRRCALAHMIEWSGHKGLLLKLSETANNAYISQLLDEEALGAWLEDRGFTAEEVAYIQGPSFVSPPPPSGDNGAGDIVDYIPIGDGEIGDTSPGGGGEPGTPGYTGPGGGGEPSSPGYNGPGGGGRVPVGAPSNPSPGQGGSTPGPGIGAPSSGPAAPGQAVGRRKKASGASLSFGSWWQTHRDVYVDLRARYHNSRGITASGDDIEDRSNALRPDGDELAAVEAVFKTLRQDPAFETPILMAFTEADRSAQSREHLAAEIVEMLGKKNAAHLPYAVMALGRSRADSALAPLLALMNDSKEGRKIVRSSSGVNNDLRAMAALALAQLARSEAVQPLMDLIDSKDANNDMKASAILALGLLARKQVGSSEILPYLVALTENDKLQNALPVQSMAALGITADRSIMPTILNPLKRFRGSAEMRRAAAASVGAISGDLERSTFEILAATAHRDPDAMTRQLAILAIGEMAAKDRSRREGESEERRILLNQVGTFLNDGVHEFFKQRTDRPFFALSAGLFAGSHPEYRDKIVASLESTLEDGKNVSDRAAAALGLGLTGSEKARPVLRKVLGSPTATMIAGYAAESLGLLDDQASKKVLRALALESKADFVNYQATIALTALGDIESQPALLEALASTRSESVRGALARALGQVGDRRSIGSLLEIAAGTGRNQDLRLRAIAAIGLVLRRANLPWSLPARQGIDPSSYQPTPKLVASFL